MHKIIARFSYNQKVLLYLVLIAFVLLFGNNWVSLWDQDESAYAGFALNMIKNKKYLIPEFIWSEVHRKPPLHFWLIALSYKIFGIHEFSVRFPSSLAVLSTYALLYFSGKKFLTERIAFYSVIILSTSFLVPSLAKISVTDSTLMFFTTLCAMASIHVLLFRNRTWVLWFWIGFAFALLTKGPPVIIFCSIFIFILIVLHPLRKNLILLHPWFFLPVSLLPILYWGYLCNQTTDGKIFIQWMLDWYILKRISGSVFGQTAPPGTHLIALLVFFIPYLAYFLESIIPSTKLFFKQQKSIFFIIIAWFVAGWLIYEFSPSKLPAYVIAAHIPLSILIAFKIQEHKIIKTKLYIQFVFMFIIPTILLMVPWYFHFSKWLMWSTSVIGILLLLFLILLIGQRKSKSFYKYLFIYNYIFQFAIWCIVLPFANELKNSSKEISQYIKYKFKPDTRVIIGNNASKPPSLPYYLLKNNVPISECYDEYKIDSLFNSSTTFHFILNEELTNKLSQKNKVKIQKTIIPFFTDRKQATVYYLLTNHKD